MMNKPLSFDKIDDFVSFEDLYICAMGFEERSLASNRAMQDRHFKTRRTFVIRYTNYEKENEIYRMELEQIWSQIGKSFSYIPFDTDNRDGFIKTFHNKFKGLDHSVNSITINISSMITFPLIWIINFALHNAKKIRIVYTEPGGYKNQLETDKQFSSGLKEIFTTEDFIGTTLPAYPNLLITFLGHDFVRTRGIYEQFQPSRKIGILAKPDTLESSGSFSKIEAEHSIDYPNPCNLVRFSPFELDGVITQLSDIRTRHIENNNIYMALNGAKLHHVAALLFANKFRDTQMIFSSPLEYFPSSYSYGSGKTYVLEITREEFAEFLQA